MLYSVEFSSAVVITVSFCVVVASSISTSVIVASSFFPMRFRTELLDFGFPSLSLPIVMGCFNLKVWNLIFHFDCYIRYSQIGRLKPYANSLEGLSVSCSYSSYDVVVVGENFDYNVGTGPNAIFECDFH